MIVLGLSCLAPSSVVHDVTAALLVDGKIASSVSEDRFTGIKHYNGYPVMSIKYCLEKEGLRISDVDKIAVGYGLLKGVMDPSKIDTFFSYPKHDMSFFETPIERKNPVFYDHEYVHAKCGYFFSGFEKAVVIALDGGGVDNGVLVSGGIFVIDKGATEVLRIYPQSATLGWTYGGFTQACGFRMVFHEGKIMSLSAYAENEPTDVKDEIHTSVKEIFPKYSGMDYDGGGIEIPKWKLIHNSGFARFEDPRLQSLVRTYSKELIAWSAQKVLEDIIVQICKAAVEFTGIKNVILTGGVFFNMIANMVIREELEKMNCSVFVNPVCGDMGNAMGVAMEEYYQHTGKRDGYEWPTLSLGPEYDNEQILSAISRMNLSYSKVDKISTTVDLIDKGKCVGWFQGRSELGPRGLGNRSLLCRADDIKYKDIMNEKVKHRESWRPFCPTITNEKADYYLENSSYAPYMIMGFRMKHSEEAPAVSHIDNTTRPQTLKKKYNEDFYDVVKGMNGIVLNTSLNLAGDPTNVSPEQALFSFKNSEMDALVIEDFLIQK